MNYKGSVEYSVTGHNIVILMDDTHNFVNLS
jgi:hypothetical protein